MMKTAILAAGMALCVVLAHGARTAAADSTPLIEAVKHSDVAQVKKLLAAGADVNETILTNKPDPRKTSKRSSNNKSRRKTPNSGGGNKNAPLHHAASDPDTTILKLLIEAGADVNLWSGEALSSSGGFPLDVAVKHQNVEAVGLLIAAGADPNRMQKGVFGSSTLPLYLIDYEKPAAGELLTLLIKGGANVNAVPVGHENIIFQPVIKDNPDCVRILVKAGVDVNATSRLKEYSPLCAVTGSRKSPNQTAIADALIKGGASLTERYGLEGYTPLNAILAFHLTTRRSRDDEEDNIELNKLVTLYIDNGADAKAFDSDRNTPLHHAVEKTSPMVMKTLLDGGADPDVKNNSGKTPKDLVQSVFAHKNFDDLRTQLTDMFGKYPK